MEERRNSDRLDAHEIGLRVYNTIDGEQIGIVGNLSRGGMMLITNRELYVHGVLQLRIDALPAALSGDPISLGMKVLWCTPANSPNEYWAGLKTIDLSQSDGAGLQRLLHYLQHGDPESGG